jgi:hypothetical protein
MLDVDNYFKKDLNVERELKQFKIEYNLLIENAKNFMLETKHRKKGNARIYWKLARALHDFLERSNNKFRITNYRKAFERDLDLTDSVIGILLDFARFFKENEIDDRISISLYYEIVRKARKLEKVGLLQSAKIQLSQMADNNVSQDAKKYRRMLEQMI